MNPNFNNSQIPMQFNNSNNMANSMGNSMGNNMGNSMGNNMGNNMGYNMGMNNNGMQQHIVSICRLFSIDFLSQKEKIVSTESENL